MSKDKKGLGSAKKLGDVLGAVAKTVDKRAASEAKDSYTVKLLAKGRIHCAKKIAEEGAELGLAIAAQGKDETVEEGADLLYHMLVGLHAKGVSLDALAKALADRQGLSGLTEKASRRS